MSHARLAELFGGAGRLAVLRELYLSPDSRRTASAISRASGQDVGNVNRWLNRWATLGLALKHVDGRNVLFQASPDPLFAGLRDMLFRADALFADIRAVVPEEATTVLIYGSVARGEEDALSDVDVLVLGPNLSSIQVGAALKGVGRKHNRTIHATVLTEQAFQDLLREGDGFAKSVAGQKTISLKGALMHATA